MSSPDAPPPAGLQATYLANRGALQRFLAARGAGEAAEDLLQEVWLRLIQSDEKLGPVGAPLAYLYRIANSVMIDRYRSLRQAARRDSDWVETTSIDPADQYAVPSPERAAIGRDLLDQVARRLEELGPRAAGIFRRHRVDGVAQRQVAEEFGVSLSTVESDLRVAYRAIAELKEQFDEA